MKAISVGLLGLGTVGTGVVQIIENHQDKLMHQIGCPIQIKKILVSDVNKKRTIDMDSSKLTVEADDILLIQKLM